MSNTFQSISAEIKELLDSAWQLKKWPIAKLISLVETETEQGIKARQNLMHYLHTDTIAQQKNKNALVLGITGTPGAGKSSLINALSKNLLTEYQHFSVAVLAIDPSSQKTGGAILGDRTRMEFADGGDRLFVRSQASDLDLGGLGRKTFHVVRLLKHFFDVVIVETVGIGQSEIEVEKLSDLSFLVLQPLAGDQVQFIKAGIMEIPDVFVVNKCDEESLAKSSFHMLRSSLKITAKHDAEGGLIDKPIFMTSTVNGRGIEQLKDFILDKQKNQQTRKSQPQVENHFLQKWVKEGYGKWGLRIYQENIHGKASSFEACENQFQTAIKKYLANR